MLPKAPILFLVDILGMTGTSNNGLLSKWHLPEHISLLQLCKLNEIRPLVRRNRYHGTICKVKLYTGLLIDF